MAGDTPTQAEQAAEVAADGERGPAAPKRASRSKKAAAAVQPEEVTAVASFTVVSLDQQEDENGKALRDVVRVQPAQVMGDDEAPIGLLFPAGTYELHVNDADALEDDLAVGDRVEVHLPLVITRHSGGD